MSIVRTIIVSFAFCAVGISSSAALELCVGAKGANKAWGCRYEFEIYVTTGECRKRNGSWMRVRHLYIDEPSIESGQRIAIPSKPDADHIAYNRNVTRPGPRSCKGACAGGHAILYDGRQLRKERRCNRKSYE